LPALSSPEVDGEAAVEAPAGGDDAVDLLVGQRLDVGLAEGGVVLDGAEEDRNGVAGEGLADPLVRRPLVKLRREVRPRARALGRKPTSAATRLTRALVSAARRPVSFSAFDAVATLTPAAIATSRIVIASKRTAPLAGILSLGFHANEKAVSQPAFKAGERVSRRKSDRGLTGGGNRGRPSG